MSHPIGSHQEGMEVVRAIGERNRIIRELQAKNEELTDLIIDMSYAINCLLTGTPIRNLDEVILRSADIILAKYKT